MSIDLYLDPVTGDIPATTRTVTGADLVRQRIAIRLQTGTGEWFLDPSQGLPLLEWRQDKPPDPAAIAARIASEIASTPGVLGVADFDGAYDQAARELTISGRVQYDDGTVEALTATRNPVTDHNVMWLTFFTSSGAITGGVALPTSGSL